MLYKPDINRIIMRYKAFWAKEILDRVPIRVRFTTDFMMDNDWSCAVQTAEGHFSYWEKYIQLRADLYDDEIPTAVLDMGPALMPAILGAEVSFANGTSWSSPIIHNPEDVDALRSVRFDSSNTAINELLKRASYFAERARGKCAVGIALLTGGADILGFLRGVTEAYIDMYENEKLFSELLYLCTDAWIAVQQLQFDNVPQLYGGYCDNYGIWTPGRSSYFANDLSSCVSADTYRRLMYEQDCRMAAALELPWIHTHSMQLRLIPEFLKIPCLHGLQIVNDGSAGPDVSEVLPYAKMVQQSGKCLILRKYTMEELAPLLPELSPKGLLIDTQCDSLSEAKCIVKDFTAQEYMHF